MNYRWLSGLQDKSTRSGRLDFRDTTAMPDSIGGNVAHMAPEVYNAVQSPRGIITVNYSGQPVFEAGVLLWELATLTHPIPGYPMAASCVTGRPPNTRVSYSATLACSDEGIVRALTEYGYPTGFPQLIASMVAPDPTDRPSLSQAAVTFHSLFTQCPCGHDDVITQLRRELVSD